MMVLTIDHKGVYWGLIMTVSMVKVGSITRV